MSDQVAIILAIGLVASVLLALVLNRKLRVWWGKNKKGVEVGGGGDSPPDSAKLSKNQKMVASNHGVIEDAEQSRKSISNGQQSMQATGGGKLKGVKQHISTGGDKK